jgi:23S rRNA pseudouridine1911/1915/1917 synthase
MRNSAGREVSAGSAARYSGYSGIVDTGTGPEMRLDLYAAERLKLLSRSQIKTRSLEAKLNGKPVKLSRPVKSGDRLELRWQRQAEERLEGEDIPLDILYEDDRVVVVNKPAGMVVHPGAGNPRGTLANALLYRRLLRLGKSAPDGGESRNPRTGIVHRLDKDTSGVIIAAYDDEALAFLAAQFKAGAVRKRYAAIVHGAPDPAEGIIRDAIIRDPSDRKRFTVVPADSGKGKPARTMYRTLRSYGGYSLLLVKPRTGRTHQIRVHLKSIGHPVAGDPLYGFRGGLVSGAGLMLHACSLLITLPGSGAPSLFRAPLPARFRTVAGLLHETNE